MTEISHAMKMLGKTKSKSGVAGNGQAATALGVSAAEYGAARRIASPAPSG